MEGHRFVRSARASARIFTVFMNTGIVITAGYRGGSGLTNEDIPFAAVCVTATAESGVAGLGSSIALSRPPCHMVEAIPIMVADMPMRVKRVGAGMCIPTGSKISGRPS